VELDGKTALVTGGGRGIGRGIVDCFLREGAQVAVVQRRPLDPELDNHHGVLGISTDLCDPAGIPAAVQQTFDRFGAIDVLVNNAGIMFERSVSQIQTQEWDLMIALNMRAPLFLAQAVVPHMRERGGGSIINWQPTPTTPPTALRRPAFTV
jgi:NAD(P)-dependent dehydrogenase (short-subunit alcohol dehydrogenase family)